MVPFFMVAQLRFGEPWLLKYLLGALILIAIHRSEDPLALCYGIYFYVTRICASLGLRMKLKTLFMSDEEKHAIILICHSILIIICLSNSWALGV